MSSILNIASAIYGRVLDTRNVLYDHAIFRSYKLDVPVISVGNITLGGTGKTPLVAHIAGLLSANEVTPAVVSRGYRREDENSLVVVSDGERIIDDPEVTGDEPLELALELKGKAYVICDANRVRGSVYAVERLGADAIILDDGFQHRKVRRDLDIVVIDATAPFGGGRTVPAGRLRENLHNLSRADAVVLTRSDLADDTAAIEAKLKELNPEAPVFHSRSETDKVSLADPESEAVDGKSLPDQSFYVFCGIGNPEAFFRQLRSQDLKIAGTRTFPDHHVYSDGEIASLSAAAGVSGAKAVLTTGKDAAKLRSRSFGLPLYILKSRLVFEDETAFQSIVSGTIGKG